MIELNLLNGLKISLNKQSSQSHKKSKVLKEGDVCRKCNTPVVKKHPKRKPLKPNQTYYFEYYLLCPNCNAMYIVEEAKRFVNQPNTLF